MALSQNINQFEETGLLGSVHSAGKFKIKTPLSKLEIDHVFSQHSALIIGESFCLPSIE